MNRLRVWHLLVSLALFVSVSILADEAHTPEALGLTARSLSTSDGTIEYFVSTDALKPGQKKPLFVFIQGSGPTPILSLQEQNGRKVVASSLFIAPQAVADSFRYVVIAKPGIPFLVNGEITPPPEYWQRTSLPLRAAAVNAVITHVLGEQGVDASRVIVAGHSEGANVAARVAATNDRVTDVVFLSCGGESQMYDFVLGVRKRQARGELTPEAANSEVESLFEKFRDITAAPQATNKFWLGHTYLRWSTFFQPAVSDLLNTNARIFVGIGTEDANSPVESTEIIPVEFLRAGKQTLTYRTWPGLDHFYTKEIINRDGSRRREIHSQEVLAEVMAWLLHRPQSPNGKSATATAAN